jgi:hypothetical protein
MYNIDWGILGTWLGSLGSIVTGFMLAWLAYKQNEINQTSQKVELALRCQAHYIRLKQYILKAEYSRTLMELRMGKITPVSIIIFLSEGYKNHESESMEISGLLEEARISFSEDIIKINEEIFNSFMNSNRLKLQLSMLVKITCTIVPW